jgi:hypothetical protein
MWSLRCFRGQNPLAALVTLGGFAFSTTKPLVTPKEIAMVALPIDILLQVSGFVIAAAFLAIGVFIGRVSK